MKATRTFAKLACFIALAGVTSATSCLDKCCYNQTLTFENIQAETPVVSSLIPKNFEHKGIYITGGALGSNIANIGPTSGTYMYSAIETNPDGVDLTVMYKDVNLNNFYIDSFGTAVGFVGVDAATIVPLRVTIKLTAYGDQGDTDIKGSQTLTYDTSGVSTTLPLKFFFTQRSNFPGPDGLKWKRVRISTTYQVGVVVPGLPTQYIDPPVGNVARPATFLDVFQMTVTPWTCSNCL